MDRKLKGGWEAEAGRELGGLPASADMVNVLENSVVTSFMD